MVGKIFLNPNFIFWHDSNKRVATSENSLNRSKIFLAHFLISINKHLAHKSKNYQQMNDFSLDLALILNWAKRTKNFVKF